MTRQEWLASLKVGDEVAMTERYSNKVFRICRVSRMTKTLIIVDWYERSFRKKDGLEPGDYLSRRSIVPVTHDVKCEIERINLINKINNANINFLSLDQVQKIYRLILECLEENRKKMIEKEKNDESKNQETR